jgi:hypothetical protein
MTQYETKPNNPVAYLAPPTKIALAEQVPSCQRYAGQHGKIQRIRFGAANDPAPCSKHSTGSMIRERLPITNQNSDCMDHPSSISSMKATREVGGRFSPMGGASVSCQGF